MSHASRWSRLCRRPGATTIGCVALLAFAALGLIRIETDNSPETFFRDGPRAAQYAQFREHFGDDDVLRWAVRGDLFTPRGIALLTALEEGSANLDGVAAALGLSNRYSGRFPSWPPADLQALRHATLTSSLDRALGLTDADGELATITLQLEQLSATEGRQLLKALDELSHESSSPGFTVELIGQRDLNRALDEASFEIGRKFLPLLVGVAVLLLALAFRSLRMVVVPLAYVGAVMGVLFGVIGWLGVAMNLVLSLLPPLIFVIATATALHVVSAYRTLRWSPDTEGTASRAEKTLELKGWAIFWTGLTTFVGFISLGVSDLKPVSDLGLFSGLGIALLTLLAFSLLPSLLTLTERWGEERRDSLALDRTLSRAGRRWAEQAISKRRLVFAAAIATALLSLAGLTRLEPETNGLRYLAPDHPVRAKMERLEETGISTAGFELWLEPKAPEQPSDAGRSLAAIERLEARLRDLPEITTAISAHSFVAEAQRTSPSLASMEPAAVAGLMRLDPAAARALDSFNQQEHYRIHLGTRTLGAKELSPVYAEAEALANEEFRATVTGLYPLLLESQLGLLTTLQISLAVTLLAIALVFRLLLHSTRLALLALVPNLWPVLIVLGAMGWIGVPLDTGTVMVASIVLGLAVDDTIHTLHHFRSAAPHLNSNQAVAEALERTAPAYLLTGLVLACGFGVCALSDFAPIARFGLASSLAVIGAVISDLLLVPALLSTVPKPLRVGDS